MPPFTLVLARVGHCRAGAGAAGILLGLRLPSGRRLALFVVQAIINNVIPFTLMVYGQQRIASGLAAVLNATTPLFTLMVARVLAGEALTLSKLAGVLLGVVGVARPHGSGSVERQYFRASIGMLCILGGTLSYALLGALDAPPAPYPAAGVLRRAAHSARP